MDALQSLEQVSFPLRRDLHEEIGFIDFVRDRASRDPATIRLLLENRTLWDAGPDPLSVFEAWVSLTRRYMLYYFLTRRGESQPSFVVTDGLFNMNHEPVSDGAHLAGLPLMIMDVANRAAAVAGYNGQSPVLPLAMKTKADADLFPDYLVVHDYITGVARLAPFIATLIDFPTAVTEWLDDNSSKLP